MLIHTAPSLHDPPPMRKSHRRQSIRLAFFAITAIIYLLYRFNDKTHAGIQLVLRPLLEDDNGFEPGVEYCMADDIAHGTWAWEREFEGLDEVFKAYGLQSRADTSCNVPPPAEGQSPGGADDDDGLSEDEKKFQRIKSVAIPTLQPRGGCTMHLMEPGMMLKRLLRSPAGLTIVGDSIAQDTFQVWIDTLQSVDTGLFKKTKVNNFQHTLHINPKHASIESLVSSTGISRDRFQFPIVSFYQSDLLLTLDKLPDVMDSSARERLQLKHERDGPDWFPLWSKMLEDSNGLLPPTESTAYEEPSILVVSSGAHWNKATLGGGIEEEEFVAGYRNMFIGLSNDIKKLPFPVAAYWRSLAPAHVDCVASSEFNNARLDWASPINGHMNQWNYQWYTWMNVIARRNTVMSRSKTDWNMEAISSKQAFNPSMRYVNVWDMSLKRPEAHLGPPKDCVRWCKVGVMNYWQELLWNMIVQESSNDDYDVTPRIGV